MRARKNSGYKLPAIISPEQDVCIRAYVPDDPLYIAAFWASYEFLTSWLAWEIDDAHSAKGAATRWKTSFNASRSQWLEMAGDCGMIDIRQKPSQPCIIQKLEGGAWVDVIDLRLCVPKMRIVNGVLQQDTTGNGDWQDAGDPDNPYNPATDDNAPAPWTTPPVGESGQCLSAANVAAFINYVSSDAADWMVDGLAFFQALGVAVTILTALIDLIPLTLLTAFITSLYTQVIDSWIDVRDYNITSIMTDLLVCRYNLDGSMTEAQWTDLVADLNAWRDTLTDNDERAKAWIAIQLVTLWGNVGMTLAGQIWGITTYECAYNECEWEHTFDFTTGLHGWEIQTTLSLPDGEWVEGVGVRGVYEGQQGFGGVYKLKLRYTLADWTEGTRFGHFVTYEPSENYYSARTASMGNLVARTWYQEQVYDPPGPMHPDGWYEGSGYGKGTVFDFELSRTHQGLPQPPDGEVGGMTLTYITIWGIGLDPFTQ